MLKRKILAAGAVFLLSFTIFQTPVLESAESAVAKAQSVVINGGRHGGSSSINASGGSVVANNSNISTSNSNIVGNNNKIQGNNNTITGNNNVIYGDNNQITGNNNIAYGYNNVILSGNNNRLFDSDGYEY